MIRHTRTVRLAVVAAASALALASCAQDNSSSSGKTPASTDTSGGSSPAAGPAPSGDGTLTIGALLPQTGSLAFLGPPQFAGVNLAVKDINAAGGVLGKDIVVHEADEGDGTPPIASGSVDKLLNANVDVVIGAAASTISLSVIDKLIGAGVAEISGSNTSPALDTYPDKGFYFRTAPSDVLQGSVLGNLIVKDGWKNVAIMARQDSYGEGLAKQLESTLKQQGANVVVKTLYSADANNYTAEINEVAASKPDALALISFEEATKIIPGLIAKGVGPQDQQTYFVDGDTADYSKEFDPGVMKGVEATFPTPPELQTQFKQNLLGIDPKLKDFTYAPQDYDAVTMAALAATAAKDDSGASIASKMVEISRDGTQCSDYKECVDLLNKGQDIDYEGVSGPCDLTDSGSVSKATIGIQLYDAKNQYKEIDSVSGVLQ